LVCEITGTAPARASSAKTPARSQERRGKKLVIKNSPEETDLKGRVRLSYSFLYAPYIHL
jgi:hypothetical protein